MSARIRFFARPVHGRTHRSALTRGGRCSEPTEIGAGRKPSPAGRDGARPLQGERSRLMRPGRRRTAERLRQRVRGNGWESEQRSPPKGPSTSGNPSVSLRLTAPFAQGSLGDGGCGLPRRPCGPPRNDNRFLSFRGAERRGNPSFLRWTGVRAAESPAPTEGLPKSQQWADVGIGPYGKKRKLHRPPGPAAHSGAVARDG